MTPTRPDLTAGKTGFNRGRPVRLLDRVGTSEEGDTWTVEPLFVPGPERDELFRPGDSFRPLHTTTC